MSVVSYIFIVFLAVTVLIYYIVPKKIQWWVLLAASVVFYAYSGIDDLLIVVGTAFLVYPLTMLMEKNLEEQDRLLLDADKRTARKIKTAQKKKRKKYLVLALLIVIGALIVFKVTGFAIENIKRFLPYEAIQRIPDWHFPAPLGVSFYSFMMISYLVDVYNGRIHAQKNFLKYLSYVLYFPHITQGPIARYELVAHQLWEKHKFDYDTVIKGTWLILWGALKKMVMADRISPFVTEVFKHSDQYEGMIFFLAAVMYSIQIYCDFSGCMDIVRGTSECFGITLGGNFRRPYFSQTLPEFWRRWHISLGAFFREYVFYPVSTSKILLKWNTKVRKYLGNAIGTGFASCVPILCVWILTGLWHGAKWNYIGWGLFHGILICLSTLFEQPVAKLTEKLNIRTNCISWNIFRMLRTFLLCVIGRIIFMGSGIRASFHMIASCVVDRGTFYDIINTFALSQREWGLILIGCLILLCVSVAQEIREQMGIKEDIRSWLLRQNLWLRWLVLIVGILCVLTFGVYGSGSHIAFIYEQF